MNSIVVLIWAIVFFIGYRIYAKYIDTKVIQSDRRGPLQQNVHGRGGIHAHQQKHPFRAISSNRLPGQPPSLAPLSRSSGLASCSDLDSGRRPLHRLGSGLLQRHSGHAKRGASFGGLSHKLISPRARVILLAFIYFYLLLIAGAFGNVVVSTAISSRQLPWLGCC